MIDINLIRENLKVVEENFSRRKKPEVLENLKKTIKLDKEWRAKLQEIEKIKHEKNILTEKNAKTKDKKLIVQSTELNKKIESLKVEVAELDDRRQRALETLPNLLHESVPYGADDNDNVEVRRWGKIVKPSFPLKSHEEIMISLDIVDIERAAKTSGARFYYLKNEAVILEQALIRFALDALRKKEFSLIAPPNLIKRRGFFGTGFLPGGENDLYKIEGEDLYLIGTSEVAMGAMHMDEVLEKLPLKYAGISPCYRTEAGSHGKDTKGIFRVHQFSKIEQFIYCKPEESWKVHEELITNAEEMYQKLGLPYHVVNICTGDIGAVAAKKYDIEVWMPVQEKFREVVSCSNCTDYQARRLNVKYRNKNELGFMHTLNSTLFATTRTIVAIVENFQQKDGSILIPEALQKYTGFDRISKKT